MQTSYTTHFIILHIKEDCHIGIAYWLLVLITEYYQEIIFLKRLLTSFRKRHYSNVLYLSRLGFFLIFFKIGFLLYKKKARFVILIKNADKFITFRL